MADEIIHEYRLNIVSTYLALPIVKQVLANGTNTTLIHVVYSLIGNQFRHIRPENNGYKLVQCIHTGIFLLMLSLVSLTLGFSPIPKYTRSLMVPRTPRQSTFPTSIGTFICLTSPSTVQLLWKCLPVLYSSPESHDRNRPA
jgi:hypothetical protein